MYYVILSNPFVACKIDSHVYKSFSFPSPGQRCSSIALPHDQACERDSSNDSKHARARHRSRTTRLGAAARTVVGDVGPLGSDFEDGAWAGVAAIVVVDEEEVGRGAVVACERKELANGFFYS